MIKDYYYILGIDNSSSISEIKNAHRKLSVKFHPDKNEGDEFFEARFKEIQEAYEVLIDPIKRKDYDAKRASNINSSYYRKNNSIPVIEMFKCDKTHIVDNELLTIEWKVINADRITISCLKGNLENEGSRTIRTKGLI